MPKVSVIVPCYNATKYLDVCMKHLLNQTIGGEPPELVLVDDASTDDGATLSLLKAYESKYPDQIILIPLEENMRQGGARNIGLMYATGEYIAYCDADDWFVDGALERLYDIAKKYDCDVVEFDNVDVRSYDQPSVPVRSSDREDEYWEIDSVEKRREYLVSDVSTLGCWNKLYRASMLKEHNIRYAEHVVWEEPAFTYMVRFYEKKHYYLHEILHYCFLHSDSTTKSGFEKRKFDNMITHETLLNDIVSRGFLDCYRKEVEFIFWHWYFHSSLLFAAQRQIFYTNEEFVKMQEVTARVVPNIKENPYFWKSVGAIPQLADLTYCDGSRLDMNEVYEIYRILLKEAY